MSGSVEVRERSAEMVDGVARLLDCLGPVTDQDVLVVFDSGTDTTILGAFQDELDKRGARRAPVALEVAPGRTDAEAPADVTEAMIASDAVVELTTVSVRHSRARQLAQEAGTRYLYIGNPDPARFNGSGAVYADFAAHRDTIQRLADMVTGGREMTISTDAGTDLRVSLEGRCGRALTGMADQPGMFGTPPCLEWGLVPSLDGVEGTVVVDAWAVALGLLDGQVRATVRDGKIVSVEDTPDGDRLRRLLDSAGKATAYQVCEIGVGMNPEAEMIDDMMSAEAVLGTAHIAVGTTPADPGVERVDAGMHIDLVFWRPTITIDGTSVMVDGQLQPVS